MSAHYLDGVGEAADTADLRAWQRNQQCDGSGDVAACENDSGDDECARDGAASVLDLFAHEGTCLAAAEREEDCRPEDGIFEVGVRSHACRGKLVAEPNRRMLTAASTSRMTMGIQLPKAPRLLSHFPNFSPRTLSAVISTRQTRAKTR